MVHLGHVTVLDMLGWDEPVALALLQTRTQLRISGAFRSLVPVLRDVGPCQGEKCELRTEQRGIPRKASYCKAV